MEAFPDALLTLGGDRRIRSWHGCAAALFGLDEAEASGSPIARLLLDPTDEEIFDVAALRLAGRLDAVLRARGAGGPIEVAFTLSPFEDGVAVVARALDAALTPAGAAPERWGHLLGGALRRLLESGVESEADLAPLIVAEGARLLPGFDCILNVVPPDRPRTLVVSAGTGEWGEALVGTAWSQEGTLSSRALRTSRPVEVVEARASGELTRAVEAEGYRSSYVVPLLAGRSLPGRRNLGVLSFNHRGHRFCTPYERRLMLELSGLVSLALQRAELQRLLEEANRRLEVGVDLARDLAGSLDPADVVRRLLERTVSACAADRVTLLRLEGEEMLVEDGVDLGGMAAERGVRAPLASLVSRSGRRRPLLEALAGPRVTSARGYRMPGFSEAVQASLASIRHTLFLPLTLGGLTDCVLIVSRREERSFSRGEQATLRLIGNVAVLALRNSRLYARAREDGRVKSDFLNLAAHELRTPLTVVLGYLSMLEEGAFGPPNESWGAPLRLLTEKVHELTRLVDGLLMAGRLETGRLTAGAAPFDLREAAEGAVARARPAAERLGGRIELVIPARRVEVVGDAGHVGTILDSLLENGLSYSDGPPAVRLVVDAASGPRRIAVEDWGRGIPREHRDRIFDRFYRAEQPGTAPPGTGLGLHISRELAEALGGRLWLDWTEPGHGSRFILELPEPGRDA